MKKKLVLSLGSNLGNRYAYLLQAIVAVNEEFDTLGEVAQFYETPPWGDTNQSRFINTAMVLETALPPDECIGKLQDIEKAVGRIKTRKWGPRAIDIDILFYDNLEICTADLIIPHPHLHKRAFVLQPLQDLMANFIHPSQNKTIDELLSEIENDTAVFKP